MPERLETKRCIKVLYKYSSFPFPFYYYIYKPSITTHIWTDTVLQRSHFRAHILLLVSNCFVYVIAASYSSRSQSYHTDTALQRYFFDMRSETLPAEAEMVTGAVLRVYKFPAYINMASASAGYANHSRLILRVFTNGEDVTRAGWVISVTVKLRV